MALRHIVKYPHKALTTPAKPVEAFDSELHQLIDDMAETMYANDGVGLAANQIDVLQRVTVIDAGGPDNPQLMEIVNPEILEREGEITWEEGCLSFPDLFEKVKRAAQVKVRYFDRNGEAIEVEAEGLLAVALQHEIDHLDGVVFTERMGPLKKRNALKTWEKIRKDRIAQGLDV